MNTVSTCEPVDITESPETLTPSDTLTSSSTLTTAATLTTTECSTTADSPRPIEELRSLATHFNRINYRVIGELGRLRAKFSTERLVDELQDERGDVPGWVLVVLMTTGLVTAIWTIAAPRLQQILKNSLDSMSNIR